MNHWAPRKGKAKKGARRRAILVQTGRLRRSPRIVATTASSVTIGTDVGYARGLQEGNPFMPARPFITCGPSTRAKIVRKAAADIEKLLSRG